MSVTYLPAADVTANDADLLVNTVNTEGVMGKGVALAFRRRWPTIMKQYGLDCRNGRLLPGQCLLYELPDGRLWAALSTKKYPRYPSRLEWIRTGVAELAVRAERAGVRSIALPPPGCGNGGLDWAEVEPIVIEALSHFDLRICGAASTLSDVPVPGPR